MQMQQQNYKSEGENLLEVGKLSFSHFQTSKNLNEDRVGEICYIR